MTGLDAEPTWLTPLQVRMLHAETLRLFGGRPGLRDENLLASAVARPKHLFTYQENPTLFDLAAAYGYGLARNHPFIDGNKRVALLAVRAFVFIHGRAFSPDQAETVTMIETLAAGTVETDALAAWIRANTSQRA